MGGAGRPAAYGRMEHDKRFRIHGTVLLGPERFPGRLELAFDPLNIVRYATLLTTTGVPSAVVTVPRSHTVVVSSSRNTGTSSDGHPVPPPSRWKVRETTSLSTGASGADVSAGASSPQRPAVPGADVATVHLLLFRHGEGDDLVQSARELCPVDTARHVLVVAGTVVACLTPGAPDGLDTERVEPPGRHDAAGAEAPRARVVVHAAGRRHADRCSLGRRRVMAGSVDRRLDHASETRRGAGRGPHARAEVRIRTSDRRRRDPRTRADSAAGARR